MTMQSTDVSALRALERFEAESRQSALPDDARVTAAKRFLAEVQMYGPNGEDSDEADRVIVGLLDYATERLRVNRGLLAQAKQRLDPQSPTFDASALDNQALLAEVARRLSEVR